MNICMCLYSRQFIKMKAVLALLVVLGLSSCVLAGSYGGGVGYQTYAAYRPAVYQQVGYAQAYHQPYYHAQPYTGKAVGVSGAGSEIIIIIVIMVVFFAVIVPALIGSLASSNEALWKSIG